MTEALAAIVGLLLAVVLLWLAIRWDDRHYPTLAERLAQMREAFDDLAVVFGQRLRPTVEATAEAIGRFAMALGGGEASPHD